MFSHKLPKNNKHDTLVDRPTEREIALLVAAEKDVFPPCHFKQTLPVKLTGLLLIDR